MSVEHAYCSAGWIDSTEVNQAVLVTGRINQPQIAEQVLEQGQADFCGMTRALISDPDMPKAMNNRVDDIRSCIACNQACIGHYHRVFVFPYTASHYWS